VIKGFLVKLLILVPEFKLAMRKYYRLLDLLQGFKVISMLKIYSALGLIGKPILVMLKTNTVGNLDSALSRELENF
jgi:hypothetical protein